MPNKRDLNLWSYSISKNRYRQLLYYCKQYNEWKKIIAYSYGVRASASDGLPRGNKISNPVEMQAFKNEKYKESIKLIEQTCKEANIGIWKQLLDNVTDGIAYENMNVPCGRRQFYNSRRKFFYMLDLKLP